MLKLYVGNMSWSTSDESLRDAFSQYGEITDCIAMKDRNTGKMRGFGFVTFATEAEATSALQMDGRNLDGRPVRVNPAEDRKNSGGGGYGGGGGGYGGNSYGSSDGMQW
ncbi:Heterogeneous nuclear ribonucleoprotein G RNA recognition motif protein [Mycena sanguinolenta]|uniref:Heterogeneous nuclear ribonucleoprotein G RNA recognition motif protein n=1 Tax=Mycena sanguinolenta TaxID=230812 RepID=A0A8H7CV96_9AGAR|nr:Heterogeneous nuclear ribonucleoprotein G RNA recognition motif protein [Mycena sanguinolenta]